MFSLFRTSDEAGMSRFDAQHVDRSVVLFRVEQRRRQRVKGLGSLGSICAAI
jgi:hypothetical protein